jgi:autotransporter-associated beta strand protein
VLKATGWINIRSDGVLRFDYHNVTCAAGWTVTNNNGTIHHIAGTYVTTVHSPVVLVGTATNEVQSPALFDGVIGGTGSLKKTGSNTLTLAAANIYAGDTTVAAGYLRLTNGANRLPVGTRLTLGGSGSSGAVDLNGCDQEVAGLETAGAGAGNVVTNASVTAATLTVNTPSASPSAYGGALAGNLSLVKTGPDRLTLSGVHTYTGPTTVSNGTLTIDGTLPAGSPVTVVSNAAFGGTGTVGNVTWDGGGAFEAGSTNLNVGGSLVFTNAGANYIVNLPAGFDTNTASQVLLLRATGAIEGFDANLFTVTGVGSGMATVSTNASNEIVLAYFPTGSAALTLDGISHANGTNTIAGSILGSADVVVDVTTDLMVTNWQPVATQTLMNTSWTMEDPAPTNGVGIYRARTQ